VGPDGGGSGRAALGLAGAADQMRRIPWILVVFVVGLAVPFLGSRFYTFVATDIVILALFAMSLNLLLGYTGLVSFGQAAYFAIGAYTCALLMKSADAPFLPSLLAAGVMAAACALVFGFFCVRLTRIYFAMLTLAFAQIVWAICFKWNELTGGEQGMPEIPYPGFGWLERFGASVPLLGGWRTAEYFYFLSVVLIMTLLGGMGTFYGPSVGALVLILLNQQIVSYTEYWPLVLGTVLVVLLFGFPGGIAGAVGALSGRLVRRVRSA